MPTHDIVVIGASAGGIDAIRRLIATLPADFPGAIIIVQHLHPQSPGTVPASLQSLTKLRVHTAVDGMAIEPGHVYVAPPDRHVLLTPDRLHVTRGPEENRHRPAVDPLFRSAAYNYGRRVVAVVLSGTMDDGASGLWSVRTCGGITIVQDPTEAQYSEMPTSALMTLDVDYCLGLDGIASTLDRLARESVNGAPAPAPGLLKRIGREAAFAAGDKDTNVEDMDSLGKPSGFSCPACHGVLWELDDGKFVHYRCHIGHAFGPDTLLAAQADEIDMALESALRALEEKGAAARRLRDRMSDKVPALAARYETQAAGTEEHAALIRRVLRRGIVPTD